MVGRVYKKGKAPTNHIERTSEESKNTRQQLHSTTRENSTARIQNSTCIATRFIISAFILLITTSAHTLTTETYLYMSL